MKYVEDVEIPEVNPISGRTLEEEIAIARVIGGRLLYRVYLSLIRRGLITPMKRRRCIEVRGREKA